MGGRDNVTSHCFVLEQIVALPLDGGKSRPQGVTTCQ